MINNVLGNLSLNSGKITRLKKIMYQFGPGNGKIMVLPYDQGLEHGPRDFFTNPESKDPDYIYNLAIEGGFSAVAVQIGIAEKYHHKYAGDMPLILKLNGKTEIPSDAEAFSPLNADVEDAVRLGADAVGYTLYIGSPSQDKDFIAFKKVRQDCKRFGMPLITWAYPRGSAVDKKGGKNSFYAVDYAARVAQELGADIVKVNFPVNKPETRSYTKKPYSSLDWGPEKCMEHVVKSAGKTFVIVSGGEKADDEKLLNKVEHSIRAGAIGIIFGRNIWQRSHSEALKIVGKIKNILTNF